MEIELCPGMKQVHTYYEVTKDPGSPETHVMIPGRDEIVARS